MVEAAKPTLKTPVDVVKLAATLETVARDTYLADLAMYTDKESRFLMATVMGVETQHLATLRAVQALLEGGGAALIAIPTDAERRRLVTDRGGARLGLPKDHYRHGERARSPSPWRRRGRGPRSCARRDPAPVRRAGMKIS